MKCWVIMVVGLWGLHSVLSTSNLTHIGFHLPKNWTQIPYLFKDNVISAFNNSRYRYYKLFDNLNNTLNFLKNNGSLWSCVEESEMCVPDVPSCCPGLHCVSGKRYSRCGNLTSGEEDDYRFHVLEDGDDLGVVNSHPWQDSWAFESRSAMQIEDDIAAEEENWRKNRHPENEPENNWVKMFKNLKEIGKEQWVKLRKLRKLKEVKRILKERLLKHSTEPGVKGIKVTESPELPITAGKSTKSCEETSKKEPSVEGESEESIIKFSDEERREKHKFDFKFDNLIADAAKLLKKRKENKHVKKDKPLPISKEATLHHKEDAHHANEKEDTEEKLQEEINYLKALKQKQYNAQTKQDTGSLVNIDEMIKKHVATILEEERKLQKIEELRRLEDMKDRTQDNEVRRG